MHYYILIFQCIVQVDLIILLMMNSMIGQRIPLSKLQIMDLTPSPLKRKAKIFAKKLPSDFFHNKKMPLQSEHSGFSSQRNLIQTQSQTRRITQSERVSATRETGLRRGQLSARVLPDQSNTISLLMGIISSTREIRKSIRKHSLELKRDTKISSNIQNMRVELPPLFLKKGVTTPF